jgi:hypothetical protein
MKKKNFQSYIDNKDIVIATDIMLKLHFHWRLLDEVVRKNNKDFKFNPIYPTDRYLNADFFYNNMEYKEEIGISKQDVERVLNVMLIGKSEYKDKPTEYHLDLFKGISSVWTI